MSQLEVGDLLEDRYRIDHPIARGGMSTVYRCVDLRLARAVAVKVMDARYCGDPVFRHRFRREAQAMAQLSHPNLVGVYDFGSDGDRLFLVMELITGGTLRELFAERGPMPPHAASAVMHQVLTGLDTAHQAGMIHRDLKPDNVLIGADHTVKLADFGLVRAASAATEKTDKIVGTAAYLSPEQVRGSELTPASDVYSAGIVLFELLTGGTPFTGATSLEQAYARLDADVPNPSERIAGVPGLFDELVASATAAHPEDRFCDASEFLAALDDVARELQLPHFQVPVPRNAAAHRAAAVPTDMTGLPGVLAPTGVIEPAESAEHHESNETRVYPAAAAQPGTETSVMPSAAEPGSLPPAAPTPRPARPQTVPAHHDYRKPKVSNRSPWRLVAWLVVVLLLLGAIAVGGWWLGSGRYGEIPQVIGMDQTSAVAEVEDAGFVATTREVYDNDTPKSLSSGTDPEFGERAIRGNEVAVLVSLGKPIVPELSDAHSPSAYQDLLSERTLSWQYGEETFSDAPPGQLARVEPEAGTEIPVGDKVTLHLSKGPEPVKIPKVSGMKQDQATDALKAAGLNVSGTREEFSSDTRAGEVIKTDPPAGEEIGKGQSVKLVLSNAIEVPKVIGLDIGDAQDKLAEAGIAIREVSRDPAMSAGSALEVVEASPGAGDVVDPANPTVELVLPGKVKVPSVIGKSVDDAIEELTDAGLSAESNSASGRVYRQTPGRGRTVAPDSTVQIYTTSRG